MKKTNKSGFTIVELVIVIAVIAILAAVLIPTFSSVIKKANESKDIQMCKNVNTAVMIEATTSDIPTCHDAVVAAGELGYSVEKFTPTSEGFRYIWNEETRLFALINDAGETVFGEINSDNTKNWIISDSVDDTYQTYLKKGYSEVSVTSDKGIDVGYNENMQVTYNGTQATAIVRTFNGILNVNSETGTIKHYGEANELNVIKTAMTSYHEYGSIHNSIKLTAGNLVIENGSVVCPVTIVATNASDVIVENKKQDNVIVFCENNDVLQAVASSGKITKTNESLGEVTVNGEFYKTFKNALAEVSNGQTIKLEQDVAFVQNDDIIIAKDKEVVIDLNGHTISGSDNKGGTFNFIEVNGNLTVKDTSSAKSGKITYASSTPDPSWGYGTSTVRVYGNNNTAYFTLESGLIENTTVNGASYAVDISSNQGNSTFYMKGGFVTCPSGDQAVRFFCNSETNNAVMEMTGGEIIAGGIWMQQASDSTHNNPGELTISGGTVNGKIDLASNGSQTVTITGGTINATVLRIRNNCTNKSDTFVNIKGGTIKVSEITSDRGITDSGVLKNLITIEDGANISESCDAFKALK